MALLLPAPLRQRESGAPPPRLVRSARPRSSKDTTNDEWMPATKGVNIPVSNQYASPALDEAGRQGGNMKRTGTGRIALLVAVIALAAPAVAQANEVTHWNRIAMSTLVAFPGPAGGAPPALQINMGMTQG